MTYIRFFYVLYWFAPFLKFGPLPSENPRCAPEYWESLCKSKRPKNSSYETLVLYYKDPLMIAQLHFFSYAAGFFKGCSVSFQTDSPMVQLLSNDIEEKPFRKLCRLVLKPEVVDEATN